MEITPAMAQEMMTNSPEAFEEMKKAKTNRAFSNVLGAIGGALVGFPVGQAIGGGDPNWTLAAVGGGLIAVSIPFAIAYKKHAGKAVSIYNAKNYKTSFLEFELSPAGMNLVFRF